MTCSADQRHTIVESRRNKKKAKARRIIFVVKSLASNMTRIFICRYECEYGCR